MSSLLSDNQAALRMLFTEDIYIIDKTPVQLRTEQVKTHISEPLSKDEIEKEVKTDFEYVGDNNKYFLVLINDAVHTRMNPVHQDMLMKVMAAKKLELRDLAIVNISRYHQADFNSLKAFFTCNYLVMFGVDPLKIGLPATTLNKAEQKGNVKILATYSFDEMRNSDDKKREFWNVMKNF